MKCWWCNTKMQYISWFCGWFCSICSKFRWTDKEEYDRIQGEVSEDI